ncbi:3-oxoacyl-[acyl-carrier-protein] synthase 2 [Raoultella planticola]|uniref:3-oxoacyl-[acyl-carrier-protein] synthase 2 n=1 Tax=Raoultella planticola TaxID=575 RepID=A0A485D7F1_RAOPL|nr:3-oxoacyl-[acyl-carrier-protein] synthase 2 [Raoultella planticola]
MGVSAKRIVVTGMGIVSPLGCGVQHVWQSLLAGKSGITRLSEQMVEDIPCKVAGQVPSIERDPLHGFDPQATIPAKERKKMDRFIEFALVAAREALTQAGWSPASAAEQDRTATVIATGIGGFSEIAHAVHTTDQRGPRRLSPFTIPSFLANLAAGHVSIAHGFRGPNRRAGHRLRGRRAGHWRCCTDDPQWRGGYRPLRRRRSGNSSR